MNQWMDINKTLKMLSLDVYLQLIDFCSHLDSKLLLQLIKLWKCLNGFTNLTNIKTQFGVSKAETVSQPILQALTHHMRYFFETSDLCLLLVYCVSQLGLFNVWWFLLRFYFLFGSPVVSVASLVHPQSACHTHSHLSPVSNLLRCFHFNHCSPYIAVWVWL